MAAEQGSPSEEVTLRIIHGGFEQPTEDSPGLVGGLTLALVVAAPHSFARVIHGANVVPLRTFPYDVAALDLALCAPDVVIDVRLQGNTARPVMDRNENGVENLARLREGWRQTFCVRVYTNDE